MKVCVLMLPVLLLIGCVAKPARPPLAPEIREVNIGLTDGYRAFVVAEGLKNPSHVSFHPDGRLTICDSGNGRVVVLDDGELTPVLENMQTEYWKVYTNDEGEEVKAFKIGPLAAEWLSMYKLVVTDGGQKDGEETVITYHVSSDGPSSNRLLSQTNSVPPTTDDPADLGEGNLSGLCIMPDGDTYYVCGQGFDGKTWVLGGSLSEGTLEPMFSADEHKIDVNSPMQVVPWRDNLLVIYSGTGGEADGLIVEWNPKSGQPVNQWDTKLTDPMSIAQVPGTSNQFVVTVNNWDLTRVNPGKLAILTLGEDTLTTQVICDRILGPVHCAFGPDGRLYVTCLGGKFDENQGQVIAITGFPR